MIIVRSVGLAYLMHTPQWATKPLSGAGAALHGGRANRPGTEALYLSLETQTAIAEYQQTSSLQYNRLAYKLRWLRIHEGYLLEWKHLMNAPGDSS